jgi:hypothetical protein
MRDPFLCPYTISGYIYRADIPGNCFRKDIDDYKWKRNRQESKTTIQAIENKKTRLAPLYNKGPVMYIDDGIEPIYIGKKI